MVKNRLVFTAVLLAVLAIGCAKNETQKPLKTDKHAAQEGQEQQAQAVDPETKSGSIEAGKTLSLTENYIRKGSRLTAEMSFDSFGGVTLARGSKKTFYAYWVEITSTEVRTCRYTQSEGLLSSVQHGLSIGKDLKLVLDYQDGSDAKLSLTSGGTTKVITVAWWGGGTPMLTNNGSSAIEATLSYEPRDCQYSVWIIGDSYIDWKYDARWPYYLYKSGYKKWMADHLPAANSDKMLASFKGDLKFGKPEFIIWAMGMNDGSDGISAPSSSWLKDVQSFIAECEKIGATPVLTTVPSIPTHDHSKKSKWVRESGYRYIDFSAAVTDNDGKTWHSGCLSDDGIHPSSAGAKALADQVLKDFPEIKNTK